MPNGSGKANLKSIPTEQGPEDQIHGAGSCQIVRKSYGDPIAEDLRFVVKSVVGEENFIDMQPNRSNNYCCGGGGGFLAVRVQG